MLGSLGRVSEAEPCTARRSRQTMTGLRLGRPLARAPARRQRRPEEGEAAYREVIDSTEAVEAGLALAALAILLESQQRLGEAEAVYRRAAEAEHVSTAADAAVRLGVLLGSQVGLRRLNRCTAALRERRCGTRPVGAEESRGCQYKQGLLGEAKETYRAVLRDG